MNNSLVEQEIKFYLADPIAFEERLQKTGAVLTHPRTFERNLRYDTEDLRLSRSHQVLRLRQDQVVRITYKGPSRSDHNIRIRPEIEIEVSDFDRAQKLLEALGYSVQVEYEKWRTTYSLNNLEITLDELPYGFFVEIEGEDADLIRKAAERLSLNIEAGISNSYLGLFEALKQKMGFSIANLTFEEFHEKSFSAKDLGVSPADL